MRFGVIGLGRAGSGMLAALAQHPDMAVVAAADLHAEHLARFRTEFEGSVYRDAAALCGDPDVDAVYIATPHEYHAEHVQLAAARGKHVIVEKPMALTLEDCDRMIAAVERAGVALVVGHTASFNPAVQTMRRLIVSGAVGPPAMISSTAYTDFLYRPRRPEELVTALGGGIIYNQVPHQVDAARFLGGGMAASVRAATWSLDPTRPTEGCYMAMLEFANGVGASLVYSGYDHFASSDIAAGHSPGPPERYGEARRALRFVTSAEEETALRVGTGYGGAHPVVERRRAGDSLLQAELGSLIVTCANADLRLTEEGVAIYDNESLRLEKPRPWRGVAGRGAVIDELYFAATEKRPVVHSGRWAKATLEICLAILESAATRTEVSLRHQVPTLDLEPT